MKIRIEKNALLYGALLIAALALLAFSILPILNPTKAAQGNQPSATPSGGMPSSFTAFDAQLAIRFMDKNNDGRCDSCGMTIEQCVASGMMQCSMDPNATIGVLGSAHLHADFKVYVNGLPVDFDKPAYYGRSAFMHLDQDPDGDTGGSVLHLHATGVPLWLFFQSIGGDFNSTCLSVSSQTYCNGGGKTLKFYANGQQNNQFGEYVFRNGDKLLISYGDASENVSSQLASITNYAGNS